MSEDRRGGVRKIGILGGTFDPPHNAHLAIARAAREHLGLDLVLFVPAATPWIKAGEREITPEEHRVEMTRLAVSDCPGFELSLVDVRRGGNSYSVDTITDLRCEYGPSAELFLLLGFDAVQEMDRWHRADELPAMCAIVAIGRPGARRPSELPEGHPGREAVLMEGPMLNVSATEVRRRVAEGQPVDSLLPAAVEAYIRDNGLYRERA
ncbi:MAG: nicotinate-nucleotide adenylyltransferase [Chloroflexota bacterium]